MSRVPRQRPAVTLTTLAEKKALGEPIAMVTAYDYPSAQVAEEAGVDVVLVGDSGAMTVLGYPSTVPVTLDELLMLAAAVRRGLSTPLLVGDLPFGSYEVSERAGDPHRAALRQGGRLRRGQARARRHLGRARPGDRRRRHPRDGPRRASRRRPRPRWAATARRAARPSARSRSCTTRSALQEAGCFSIVFEAIPSALTELIMPRMRDPGDRHRRRPGHRRPGARVPRPARDLRRPRRALRQALRGRPRADDRRA